MLELITLTKTYGHRENPVNALNDVTLQINEGNFIAITGQSGSGKSTLLLTIGGLIKPSSGQVAYNGQSIYDMGANELAKYRNRSIGFVLQTFNLVPYLSALENVMLPMALLNGGANNGSRERAVELLTEIGLGKRLDFLPRELSVGQQQRVAICRAMANNPDIILADEPTGNLDPGLAEEILDILKYLNVEECKTIIMVTHSPEAARRANTTVRLNDGKITN